jgi:hypothetical protein
MNEPTYSVIRIFADGDRANVETLKNDILAEETAHLLALEASKKADCLIACVRQELQSGSYPKGSYRDGIKISKRQHRLIIGQYKSRRGYPLWFQDEGFDEEEPYQIIPISECMTLRESTFRRVEQRNVILTVNEWYLEKTGQAMLQTIPITVCDMCSENRVLVLPDAPIGYRRCWSCLLHQHTHAIVPIGERHTIIDVCWNAANPTFFYPQINADDTVLIIAMKETGVVRWVESADGHELYAVGNKHGLTRYVRRDISLCIYHEGADFMPLDWIPFSAGDFVELDFHDGPQFGYFERYETPHWVSVKMLDGTSKGTHLQRLSHAKPVKPPQPLTEISELDEPHLVTVSCHICKWVHQGPQAEALETLKQHLAVHNKPIEPLPINCAECGQPVGLETVVHNKKTYCMDCGEPKLREEQDETLFLQKLSDAPDEDTPAPRVIEQPPQPEIPMKQLSLFGD